MAIANSANLSYLVIVSANTIIANTIIAFAVYSAFVSCIQYTRYPIVARVFGL